MPPPIPTPTGSGRSKLKCFFKGVVWIVAALGIISAAATFTGLLKLYRIPTGNMSPTLVSGDFITAYRFRPEAPKIKRGIPVIANVDGISFMGGPMKGQYVMRVIALPGDTVSIREHSIFVNDQQITRDGRISLEPAPVRGFSSLTYPLVVLPGQVFLIGDNYENSLDCRYFGPIKLDRITHRPHMRVFPFRQIGLVK